MRVFRMGAGQFLSDFRRDYRIQKTLAHRKALMIRREKLRQRDMKVSLSEICKDKSPGKKVSHARLVTLVHDIKADGLVSLYKKKELQLLCKGYAVAYVSKWNKRRLASALIEQIGLNQHMPCHQETSRYSVNTLVCMVPKPQTGFQF